MATRTRCLLLKIAQLFVPVGFSKPFSEDGLRAFRRAADNWKAGGEQPIRYSAETTAADNAIRRRNWATVGPMMRDYAIWWTGIWAAVAVTEATTLRVGSEALIAVLVGWIGWVLFWIPVIFAGLF